MSSGLCYDLSWSQRYEFSRTTRCSGMIWMMYVCMIPVWYLNYQLLYYYTDYTHLTGFVKLLGSLLLWPPKLSAILPALAFDLLDQKRSVRNDRHLLEMLKACWDGSTGAMISEQWQALILCLTDVHSFSATLADSMTCWWHVDPSSIVQTMLYCILIVFWCILLLSISFWRCSLGPKGCSFLWWWKQKRTLSLRKLRGREKSKSETKLPDVDVIGLWLLPPTLAAAASPRWMTEAKRCDEGACPTPRAAPRPASAVVPPLVPQALLQALHPPAPSFSITTYNKSHK